MAGDRAILTMGRAILTVGRAILTVSRAIPRSYSKIFNLKGGLVCFKIRQEAFILMENGLM